MNLSEMCAERQAKIKELKLSHLSVYEANVLILTARWGLVEEEIKAGRFQIVNEQLVLDHVDGRKHPQRFAANAAYQEARRVFFPGQEQ